MYLKIHSTEQESLNIGDVGVDACEDLAKNATGSEQRCDVLWDTKLCWLSAAVGETLELPCPPDQESSSYRTATRTCVFHNDRAVWTMANYSLCPNPENYDGLVFAIARYKFINEHDETWEYKILTVSQVTYFLSLIVLLSALCVFLVFPKLRNSRTRLHMNMLSSMILQAVMWLVHSVLFDNQLISAHAYLEVLARVNVKDASKFSSDFRKIAEDMFSRLTSYLSYILITGLERYFETATLFWLLMEGWFLHELICVKPLEVQSTIKRFVAIGWGVPVIVTLPWLIYHTYAPFNDVYWVKHDVTVYIIAVSIFVTFLVNFYFFLKIIRVLFVKIKISFRLQQKKMEYKKWVRSTFMLVLLFGAQNSLYCAWFFVEETKTKILFQLIIKVISSFQGIFVSFIYCFLNKEVRRTLSKNLFE